MELGSILLSLFSVLSLLQIELDNLKKEIPPPPIQESRLPLIFSEIARCESGNRQFYANGNLIKGPYGEVGKYQIHPIHFPTASRMGIDVRTEKGNEEYALYLYEREGLRPWSASKKCWEKHLQVALRNP